VKLVKVKGAKMFSNAPIAKDKVLLPKWFKWDQECTLKWHKNARNVKEKEIFLEKVANAKPVKVDESSRKLLIFKSLFLQEPLLAM